MIPAAEEESQLLLYRGSVVLRTRGVTGITVNEKVLEHYIETAVGIATALVPGSPPRLMGSAGTWIGEA